MGYHQGQTIFPLTSSLLFYFAPFDAIVRPGRQVEKDRMEAPAGQLGRNLWDTQSTQSRETSVASTDLSESLSVLSGWREERSDPVRLFCWPLLIGPSVNAGNH